MEERSTKIIAGALALGVTALVVAVFTFATKASDPRKGKSRTADIGELKPGSFRQVETETLRYFIVKPLEGDVYVVAVPLDEGTVPMPETNWWRPLMKCKSFGLDANNGTLSKNARFRCRDEGQPETWAARWQWDGRGKHIPDADNTPMDDLYGVHIRRDGDEIVFLSLDTN